MTALALALLLAAPAAAQSAKGDVGVSAAAWHAGELVVLATIEGSPARNAGLVHGDRIVSISGKPPKSVADLKRLRGGLGTEVTVVARARGAEETRSLSLFREDISGKAGDDSAEIEAGAAAGDPVSLTAYALGLNDRVAAADHLEKAAASGYAEAKSRYANALLRGLGRKKDAAAGLRLAREAAAAGHSGATMLVGDAYSNGWGVEKDEIEAGIWIRKAAELGGDEGMCALAERLDAGRGMPVNPEEALYWAKKALPAACAHYVLAGLLRDGRGTAKDELKAYEHAARAAHAGYPRASQLAGKLESLLSKEELDEVHAALKVEGIVPGPGGRVGGPGESSGAADELPPAPEKVAPPLPGRR